MKTNLHSEKFRTSNFLKFINIVFLGLILLSNSSFATTTLNIKDGEDSNKVIKHTPSDDKDAVKISMPTHKSINRADKEIHLNMVRLIREYTNPTLVSPDMLEADKEMNDAFFSNYRISFNSNSTISDEELNALFLAYNLMLPSADFYLLSDDEINFEFYMDNYFRISSDLIHTGDNSINRSFRNDNAE